MSVNDEFDLGLDTDLITKPEAAPPKAAKKKATKSEDAEDKSGWTRIMIDEVPGMSNYEVVGVNGKVYQIKRGVPVPVPPEVVAVLETCLMTNVEHRKNRITGESEEVVRHFSAVPWRRV